MDSASTKSRLLDAAGKVFLEHGFGAASMELVRREANVSNGSLYHHFPTRALLADALYAHTLRDFHAAVLVPISARASAQSGVKGLIRAYVRWVLQHPELARLLHELRRSCELADGPGQWRAANAAAFEALATWIDRCVQAGEMRKMPFDVWMAVVFAPAVSLTSQWVSMAEPMVAPQVQIALEHGAWMAVAAAPVRPAAATTRKGRS